MWAYQVEIMKMRFRNLSDQFKPNYEMMDGLRLMKRTFYRYKSIIVFKSIIVIGRQINMAKDNGA
jgi:hypothetical protein